MSYHFVDITLVTKMTLFIFTCRAMITRISQRANTMIFVSFVIWNAKAAVSTQTTRAWCLFLKEKLTK